MKICARCKREKPRSEFQANAKYRDGLHSWCKECKREMDKVYRGNPRTRARRLAWRRKYERQDRRLYLYGLDEVSFADLLDAQGGGCAICGTSRPGGRWNTWHIDHDHSCCPRRYSRTCGRCVRGLLCQTCNLLLGHAHDSPDRLRQALAYLDRTRATTWRASEAS